MRSRLAWLQLNPAGTEIVRAGRLIGQDATGPDAATIPDETLPAVYSSGDGAGLTLVYMTREAGVSGWGLHVAPLEIDPETDTPIVDEHRGRTIALNQSHMVPIFSNDGRTIFSVLNSDPKPSTVERISVPELERAPAAVLAASRSFATAGSPGIDEWLCGRRRLDPRRPFVLASGTLRGTLRAEPVSERAFT